MNFSNFLQEQGKEDAFHGIPSFPISVYSVSIIDQSEIVQVNHWHDELEIFFIEEGSALFHQDKDIRYRQPLYKGSIAFIPSKVLHGALAMDNYYCKFIAIVFSSRFIFSEHDDKVDRFIKKAVLMFNKVPYLQVGFHKKTDEITEYILKIRAEYQQKLPGYELKIKSYLLMILSLYFDIASNIEKASTEIKNTNPAFIVNQNLSFIHDNYTRNISVSDIAETSACSVTYLERLFKNNLMISPMVYLKNLRLTKALHLIENTDTNISEIAYSVGFNDFSYFSKCFKENIGTTPREYRKLVKQNAFLQQDI